MKSKALELIYQDTKIHFLVSNDENVMINATDMAKIFGKRTNDFINLEVTQNYIKAFLYCGDSRNINNGIFRYLKIDDIYYTKPKIGTFMNRPLALKFAAWLDSDFEVWIYNTIDKLLFSKTKVLETKIIDMANRKTEIAILRSQIISSQNETAIQLLEKMDELKKIEYQKKKAFADFASQLKLF